MGLDDFTRNVWACKKANPCRLPGAHYEWLAGFLGDAFSRIVFLAENPSLRQMEKIGPEVKDANYQWNVSSHDAIFRRALVESGFKDPPPESQEGWHCYISDIVKCGSYPDEWRKNISRIKIAKRCVQRHLSQEIQMLDPVMIVLMGAATASLFGQTVGHLHGVKICRIHHYAYVSRFRNREYRRHVENLKDIRAEYVRLIDGRGECET